MMADPRALPAADELLLEAFGRRLARIDGELPHLTPWQPDRAGAGQLHVVRGRMRRASGRGGAGVPDLDPRRASGDRWARLQLASMAMAAIVTVAVVATLRTGDVGRPMQPITPSVGPAFSFGLPSSAAATTPVVSSSAMAPVPATLAPPSRPTPLPSQPLTGSLRVVDVDPAAVEAVLGEVDWACGVLVEVALPTLDPAMLDKVVRTTDERGGFIPPVYGTGWIGADAKAAAGMFKGRLIHVDASGGLWALRGQGSAASILLLDAEPAPNGRTVWRSADVLWPADCPPPGTDAKELISARSAADWPDAQVVNLMVVRRLPPGALLPAPS
jgi:hypothetical protein